MEAMCPECDAEVLVELEPKIGHRVMCRSCKSTLTVIRLMPLELDWAFVEPFEDIPLEDGKQRTTRAG